MARTADEVMAAYSSLDEAETRAFDKRYRELMKFRKQTRALFKSVTGRPMPRKTRTLESHIQDITNKLNGGE